MVVMDLPFDKLIIDNHSYNGEVVSQASVIKSGIDWEYGLIKTRYEYYAYYSVDGKIKIFDRSPGDYFGHTLFGDTLILVGHDGAKFYNVKTFESDIIAP